MSASRVPHVVVAGGGIAGTAAAFAASRAGARVTVLTGPSHGGATALTSGALDYRRWEDQRPVEKPRTPDRELLRLEGAFVQALGIWQIGSAAATVATLSGRLRPARGCDASVLDLAQVPAGTVALPRANRTGWDADALASSYNDDAFARDTGLRFEAVDLTFLRRAGDDRRPDADLAALADDPSHLAWLAARFAENRAMGDKTAVLFGPWLGAQRPRAAELAKLVGKPVGETLSLPGGAAGARLLQACSRLLETLGVEISARSLVAVTRLKDASGLEIAVDQGAPLSADELVLAAGGLLGGGITWENRGPLPSFQVPAVTVVAGERIEPSSPYGPDPRAFAWSPSVAGSEIERVGLGCDRNGALSADRHGEVAGIFAAGDIVADRPRTVLEALRSGIEAGARAGHFLGAPAGASAPRTI